MPILIALFLSLSFLAAPALAIDKAFAGRVNRVVQKAIKEDQTIVGCVVIVAERGKPVYRKAWGYLDREAGQKMPVHAIFRLASMTKPIVAAAALRLCEEGKLSLDDEVSKWLDFQPKLADGSLASIKVRHLMNHTAGLDYCFLEKSDGPYIKAGVSDGLDFPGRSMQENLARIASVPLLFQPGSDWRYSVSSDVLGAVLEKVTGESLPNVIQKYVTSPLRMQSTDFSISPSLGGDALDRLVIPYRDGKPPRRMGTACDVPFPGGGNLHFVPARLFDNNSFYSGGGGLIGTGDDYLKFLSSIAGSGKALLSAASTAAMVSSQTGDIKLKGQPGGWGFGYGFAVLKDRDLAKSPHENGTLKWGGAYGHSYMVDRKKNLIIIILTNTAIEGTLGKFPRDVRDAVYGVTKSEPGT